MDYCNEKCVHLLSFFLSGGGGGGVERVDLAVGKIMLWDKFIMFGDGFFYRYSGSKRDFLAVRLSSLDCQKFPDVQRESCSAMKLPFRQEFKLGSIELFIEELAPPPPPPLLFRREAVPLSRSSCVTPVELADGVGGGAGAKSYDSEKAWSSINNLILFC